MKQLKESQSFYLPIDKYHHAIADLSLFFVVDWIDFKMIPNYDKIWYMFNRIFVPRTFQGKGYGTQLLKNVCDWADRGNINIYCPLNPYGILNLQQLSRFYEKQGFITLTDREMIRITNTP